MLYNGHDDKKEFFKDSYDAPLFGTLEADAPIPKRRIGERPLEPSLAYQLIKDELMNEGNARLNLATFCQTDMEDEAVRLMAETLEKNAIDKTEYPQTAEIEHRCISMIANLWNAPNPAQCIGTSTVGSSEACMLAGMAMKFRWRERAREQGLDLSKKPNLVVSSGYQVCWEKFCVYWDIELRTVPIRPDCMKMDSAKMAECLDDYTIGVVGILGITYTGAFDDIQEMDRVLSGYNKRKAYQVPIHVDAASGGLFVPFLNPELRWDFRLDNVASINTSGHKYGLIYPGIGWVLWKEQHYLPRELVFEVSYLGGSMPTIALNFSRSASQVIGQYYNFLRLGREGYRKIHQKTRDVAAFIARKLSEMGVFDLYHGGTDLPVVCYGLKENAGRAWTLYELADRLLMRGWQVPTYPLPCDMEQVVIQRIVCRADLNYDMAELLIRDMTQAVATLDQAGVLVLTHERQPEPRTYGFTH